MHIYLEVSPTEFNETLFSKCSQDQTVEMQARRLVRVHLELVQSSYGWVIFAGKFCMDKG